MLNLNKRRLNLTFYRIARKYFPRATENKSTKVKYKEKLEKFEGHAKGLDIDRKENMGKETENFNSRTEYDDLYDEYYMSRFVPNQMETPEALQKMARKVFSKHDVKDIREWCQKYMLRYSQTHATEALTDLNIIPKTKLFANSEELSLHTKLFSEKQREKVSEKEAEERKIIEIEEKRLNKNKENFSPFKITYDKSHAVAYLLCRMPFSLNVHKRILNEIYQRMPDFKPTSVLDFGSGLGSGIWAAIDVYGDRLKRIAAVEPNPNMRRLGRFLSSDYNSEILWADSLTMVPGSGIDKGKFDIIFLGYVLQELQTSRQRKLVIDMLWNRLNTNGVFIVIEPGSPKGFRFIHDLRTWALDKSREEASLISPCPHHFECPQKNKGWCHFSQIGLKFPNSVFPKLTSERQFINEKFSYLAIKKGQTPNTIHEIEEDVSKPHDKSFFWSRIIRPRYKKQQHIILDMCTKEGKLDRRIIPKSHSRLGGYKNAKNINWGELWYFPKWLPNKFRKENYKGKRLW